MRCAGMVGRGSCKHLQVSLGPLHAHPQSAPASNMAWPTRRTKLEVVDAFLRALAEKGVETTAPGYVKSIRTHFDLLPTRYALDVDIHNPATVLGHQRLLTEARSDPSVVSFAVRPVEVIVAKHRESLHSESPGAEVRAPIACPCVASHSMYRMVSADASPPMRALTLQDASLLVYTAGPAPTHVE